MVPIQGDRIEIEVGTEQDGQATVVAVGHHHDPGMAARGVGHGVRDQIRIGGWDQLHPIRNRPGAATPLSVPSLKILEFGI